MSQEDRRTKVKKVADKIGAGVLVALLVASAVTGPAWMVLAFILMVPVAAVFWGVAWRKWVRDESDLPPAPPAE